MSSSRNQIDSLPNILRGMIREEIDRTPGFRELTSKSDFPANIHAEKVILGAILLDNASYEKAKVLAPDDFSLASHRLIFLRIVELIEASHAADLITLGHKMGEKEVLEIGGVAYLCSLTEGLPRRPVIDEYVAIIQEKAKLRRIIGACERAILDAQDQQTLAADIVSNLGQELKGIRPRK